jgi:hypothetical protein
VYNRFLQRCLLRGFTFTFTVLFQLLFQFLYQDGGRAVQKLRKFCTVREPSCTINVKEIPKEFGPLFTTRLDRVGSSTDLTLNGHLKYPNNLDQSLNDAAADKIRKYRDDYNNNPPSVVSFMPDIASTSGRLHSEFVRLLFLQTHRETDRFFAVSGVHLTQPTSGIFHFLRAASSAQLKAKVGSTLVKAADLRINLNIDGSPITSRTHTHPSHSQTSRPLTSSLSLGVPVPRATQCIRGV